MREMPKWVFLVLCFFLGACLGAGIAGGIAYSTADSAVMDLRAELDNASTTLGAARSAFVAARDRGADLERRVAIAAGIAGEAEGRLAKALDGIDRLESGSARIIALIAAIRGSVADLRALIEASNLENKLSEP
jgi:outer membrane murein-binding lipoprotein Lpp